MKCHFFVRSFVGLVVLVVTPSFASAQHGGHGGGHGGHGGGHHGGGHGGHFGGHHGGGHGGHFGGGHGGGHQGHRSHFGGHGIGHGGNQFGGHHIGGHGTFSHLGGHHGIAHTPHHWYPNFGLFVSPGFGGYGYSSYYAPNTFSGSYVTGYRGVENTAAVVVEQPLLAESAPAPPNAIPQAAARPARTSEGEAFRRKAEAAFRAGDFQRAAKMANHALVEMPRDGKLLLFAAQTLFAIGDYRSAAVVIHQAAPQLDPQQWGYVVENYRQYYRGRAFVDQMDRLNEYIKKNPGADYAYFLRGYQHGFLKHHPAALKDLNKAVELESRDQLAAQLITRFGGTPPASLEQPTLELSPAVDSAPSSTSSENIDEQSLTESKESSDDHESDSHEHDH